jgi:predicted  nucleic acid-binding Zn-ribbon protein
LAKEQEKLEKERLKREEDLAERIGETWEQYYDKMRELNSEQLEEQIDGLGDIQKEIENRTDTLEDLSEEYKKLGKSATKELDRIAEKMNETTGDRVSSVAERFVQIRDELKEAAQEIKELEEKLDASRDGNERSDLRDEIKLIKERKEALQAEQRLAKENSTQSAIDRATLYEDSTQTQRLLIDETERLEELAAEKKLVEEKLVVEQDRIARQVAQEAEALTKQASMYDEHLNGIRSFYKDNYHLIEQDTRDHVQSLKGEYEELKSSLYTLRAVQQETGVNIGGITRGQQSQASQSITINVSGNADEGTTKQIARVVREELKRSNRALQSNII